VWNALNGESLKMASLLKLRLITAQRNSEVTSMRWEDLDLEQGMWTIPGGFTKNGQIHPVPLSAPAVRILKDMKAAADAEAEKPLKGRNEPRGHSPWVFPGVRDRGVSVTEVQKLIGRVRTNSKVKFRGHDLRRTASTKMTELGVSRLIVRKILNHAEPEVTAVYDRFGYLKEKREALDLWGRRLTVITSGLKVVALTPGT
jgi:integrase